MSQQKILVVDDEPDMLSSWKRFLGRSGYAVDVAENATSGLAQFEAFAPDLVITDLRMPGKDGLALLREIKAFDDLWELFSTDAREWLAGIIKGDQKEVAGYDEQNARAFERAAGLTAKAFAAMTPKDAFVVEMRSGVGRLMQLARLLAGEFVSADIVGDRATVTLRGLRGGLPLERENGRWYFARME